MANRLFQTSGSEAAPTSKGSSMKSLLPMTLGAIAASAVILAHAAEPITYKSTNFNVMMRQFSQLNSEFRCSPAGSEVSYCRSTSTTYAGADVKNATATFLHGKLSHIDLLILEEVEEYQAILAFASVETALISKHGMPERTSEAGALKRTISTWRSGGLSIHLERVHTERVNAVDVMLGRDDHWQRSVDLEKTKAKSDI